MRGERVCQLPPGKRMQTTMNLLRMFARNPEPVAKFVDGRVGYAMGDIHGRADLLDAMLAEIERRAVADAREAGPPILLFLGDYIDRGPDSARVLDLLVSGRPSICERRYIRGNHEQAMIAFMAEPFANRRWLVHGGAETMLSYGLKPPPLVGGTDEDWIVAGDSLAAALPPEHLAFLRELERYVVLGSYLFVHAGVEVSKPLEEQSDADLYWSRVRWLNNKRRFTHKVVHGHTPAERPYIDDRRVGLDTGAYASGVLTAARFEGEEVSFFAVSSNENRHEAPAGAKKSKF